MTTKKHPVKHDEPAEEPTNHFHDSTKLVEVTIAAGQALSGAFEVDDNAAIAFIIMPEAWTPAHLTFLGSFDGAAFHDLFGENNHEVTITDVNANSMVYVNNKPLDVRHLMLRSGTRSRPVPQREARTFTVVIVS